MSSDLSDIDASAFARDGFLVLRDYLDLDTLIRPLQRELGTLIERAAAACGATYEAGSDASHFDDDYLALVDRYPAVQPLVYDLAKALPSFQRLICSGRLADAYRKLRSTEFCGTAPGSNGVRIDRPGDDVRLAPWHQEFAYQFRSLDGITFWIPLVPVTVAEGPVVLARGSHMEGVLPLIDASGLGEAATSDGAYGGLRLPNENTIVDRYPIEAPESRPGDVLVFDFLTLHTSAPNRGSRARWTAQIRYFNFEDAFGASIGWSGGLKNGRTVADANALIEAAVR